MDFTQMTIFSNVLNLILEYVTGAFVAADIEDAIANELVRVGWIPAERPKPTLVNVWLPFSGALVQIVIAANHAGG